MRDLLPADMRAFRRVEDAFRHAAVRWGYDEVRTPTIENYSLFTTTGALTPQMLSRVYTFLDWDGWSGERVVLRPDSTIPVARAAALAAIPLPARLFYVQNVFRFSESGDDREDWQCGIEYLGAPLGTGDLEVAAIACETLDALGLKPEVRLSHVGVVRAIFEAAGPAAQGAAPLAGLAGLRPAIGDQPALSAFVDVALRTGQGTALLSNLAALAATAAPGALPALDELQDVAMALEESGRTVAVDLAMPRDFQYYTGVVYEFEGGGEQWGGGGRYAPAGLAGAETACGLGLEAARLASHVSGSTREPAPVRVIPEAPGELGHALAVARALHRSGIAATLADGDGASPVSVRVGPGGLLATTPEGQAQLSALDDLVVLLVNYK